MKLNYGILFLLAVFLFFIPAVSGRAGEEIDQENPGTGDETMDENELFKDETMVTEIEKEDAALKDPEILSTKTVIIGGSFISSLDAQWTWQFPLHPQPEITGPDDQSLSLELGLNLFIDARPDENLRVFAKANLLYPFNTVESFSLLTPDENIKIKEMFADTDINDTVFFRFGKQTIKWGVGYFFSPADRINIIPIDPENPDDEQEGPVALKIQMPVETTNIYLYVLDYDITKPEELGVAGKAEFVLGTLETTVGCFYQKDASPHGIIAFTLPFNDFSFFGEGVMSYGTDRTFVRENGMMLETYTDTSSMFFSGTAGFSLMLEDYDFSASAQYYFNGEGYGEDGLLRDNYLSLMMLVNSGILSVNDIYGMGMHYAAVMAGFTDIADSGFSISLLWIGNLTDWSGQIKPGVTWAPEDYLSFSFGVPFYYGDEYDEYSPNGPGFTLTLSASVGGGSF